MALLVNGDRVSFSAFRQIAGKGLDIAFETEIIDFMAAWFNDAVDSIVMYTSGSTGQAKTIQLPKEMMRKSALKTQDYFGYGKGDTAILCLPPRYIAGKMMLVRAMISELDLVLSNPSANPIDLLNRKIDFIALTPYQLAHIIELNKTSLTCLDIILLGGGPISLPLEAQITALNLDCYHSYGMTETSSHVAIRKLKTQIDDHSFTALDGVRFKTDLDNCLIIDADHLPETVYTHDVVELIDERHFKWLGRKDNIINSGAIKVSPEIMESKLSEIINVPFFISSIPDQLLGQRLVLLVEIGHNKEAASFVSDLKPKIKAQLKPPLPELIIPVVAFKYSGTGKILRKETRDLVISESILTDIISDPSIDS